MRKVYFLLLTILWATISNGQSSANYTFSTNTTASLTDMNTGTTQLVAATSDDVASAVTNIGFDFWFMGARYTQFSVNSNGYLRLGGTVIATTQYTLGTASVPLIASLGSDLYVSSTGKIHYKVVGSSPNRVLVVEYKNATIIYDGAGATADGTSQVRLYETSNNIELVYGAMNRNSSTGYLGGMDPQYIGFSTNSTNNTYATITNATNAVATTGGTTSNQNTQSAVMPNLNSVSDGSRRIYAFTPQVANAPTALNFTAVSAVGMTLNWTDNSSDELGFAVYRSTDGVNYTFVTQTAANAVSSVQSGLTPGVNYSWRVYAVRETPSAVLSASQSTNPPGNIVAAGSGNWSSTVPNAPWPAGIIPTATDNVIIADGQTVTIDMAAVAYSVTIGQGTSGVLQYEQTTARTLTVGENVTIANGGTFQSNAAGTVTTHSLSIAGNLINNGTLDFSTNANTAGAGITFTGAANNTFSGTGATTDIRTLTINKGTSNANVLELMPSNLSVQGTTVDGTPMGFLTLTNGTLKISGTYTITGRIFSTAAYTVGATTGLWLNNPNFTVVGQNGSPTLAGLLRMTQGTLNIGTSSGNSMGFSAGSTIIIEGGAVNAAGRFGVAAAGNAITYTQSGGTITVCMVGNASTTLGSFDLGTTTASSIAISGGTIVVQLAGTGATQIDYRNQAGSGITGLTGGTLQLGNAASGAAKSFVVRGVVPNLVLTNTSAAHSASWFATATTYNNISRNITVNSGTTLNLANNVFLFAGTTITNNGTITHNGASSRFIAFEPTNMTYTGTGSVTAPMTSFELQNDLNFTFDPSVSTIVTNRVIIFTGSFVNSNKLSVGNGGTTTATIQIGNTTTPTNAGGFDSQVSYNPGTGGISIIYLRTTNTRTTGFEIPSNRTVSRLTYDDNDPSHTLAIAGGDLLLSGTGTALTLTNGRIVTGANTLIVNDATATVSRTAGYVDGNLQKMYGATGSKTFEVGTANGYSPAGINVTAGSTFPTGIIAKAVQGTQPSLNPATSLARYWSLSGAGVTADLTFNYLAGDVNGTEANYKVVRVAGTTVTPFPTSTVNTTTHVGTYLGATSFSDWSLSEACAGAVGGTATGTTSACTSVTPTITASGYSTGVGSDYQWQSSNDNFATNVVDIAGQTNPAALTVGAVTTTTYYRLRVTCPAGTATDYSNIITVTVIPQPAAFTVGGGGTYCSNQTVPSVTLSGSETGVNYQLYLGASPVGSPLSGTGNSLDFGPQATAGTYTVVGADPTATCTTNMTGSVTITANPAPVLSGIPVEPTSCVSTDGSINLTVSGAAPGPYTYNWSTPNGSGLVNGQEDQAGLTVGTYTVVVTASSGCSETTTFTLVGPGGCSVCPTIGTVSTNAGSGICEGASVTVTASGLTGMSNVYGITFKYSASTLADPYTGGTVLGTVANGSLTGGGTTATFTGTIPTPGNYYIYAILTPTPLDPSCRPSSMTTLNIVPTTSVNAVTNMVVCNNANTAAIPFTGGIAGTVYSWTNNNTSIGLAANGTGDIASFLATNTGTAPVTATVTVTPSYSQSNIDVNQTASNTCMAQFNQPDIAQSFKPTSSVITGAGVLLSSLGGNTDVTISLWTNLPNAAGTMLATGTGAGTPNSWVDVSWSPIAVTPGGTYYLVFSGTDGNSCVAGSSANPYPDGQVYANAGFQSFPNYDYTFRTLSNGGLTCTGTSQTFTITVNPTPTVNTVSNQTVCNGSNTTAVSFSGAVTGTTYSWTNNNTSIGLAANGTGNIGSFPATNTGNAPVTATITVTPSYTNGATTCTGTATTFTITVNPTPAVNAVANQTVCNGTNTAAVNFSGAVAGTVYSWTNNNTSIGLAGSGTGNIAAFPATNTGTTPVTATITVTPSYTNGATTCTGTPVSFTITVNPSAAISVQPANTAACAGQSATFSVTATGVSLTYQWQVNTGSGFNNLANASPYSGVTTPTLTINPAAIGLNGNTYRVVVSSTCGTATSNAATLTVNPLPTVSVGPSGQCSPVTLTATGNSNTYSWSPALGLNTTTGATVIATTNATITYTVTGTITATGCTNTATATVLGTPPPVVVSPANPAICAGTIQQLTVPGGAAIVNSSGTITIPFAAPGTTSGPANPYPSSITVVGLPTTGVTVKSVTINGVTHAFPDDLDILLQSPTGQNVVLMSDAGGNNAITNVNYTFDDAASSLMSDAGANAAGTYRPTNFVTPDTWAAPGPGAINQATPTLSSFTGNPNGNWGLYIVDDATGNIGSIASWSITFNVPTATWTPATGLFIDPAGTIPYTAGTLVNTVYANPANTTTYTVTGTMGSCSVPSGTVTVTVNPKPTISVTPNNQCGPVTLTASGTSNTYSWSPAAGLSATTGATVTANPQFNTTYTVTGTITATGCTNTATVTVNATPAAPTVTPSAVTICRGATTTLTAASQPIVVNSGCGTITVPAGAPTTTNGVAGPYPCSISVSGFPTVGNVVVKSVTLNGVTHAFPDDLDILLQAPNGQNVILMSDAGGNNAVTGVNYTFDDAAAALMSDAGANPTGTYRPTNIGTGDAWAAPGPGTFNQTTPRLSDFAGNFNGDWKLFVVDDAANNVGSITSWSITFQRLDGAIWTPVTGLFTNPTATVPYVAGTYANTVYAAPTTTTTYSATVGSPSSSCVSAATTAVVTVLQPITITTQPANQTVCVGANATFSVVAAGSLPSYQWQISTDAGTTWNNIANANGASFVVTNTTAAMSGWRYRVIINNTCTSVTSNAAILTVNTLTTVTVGQLPASICLSDAPITLTGSPVGGSWSGIGVSGNTFVPAATAVGTYTLTYTYANTSGCNGTATVVARVVDCQDRNILLRDGAVQLYPNPNNGQFNLRIVSTLYNRLGMTVYNSAGQVVRTQQFNGLVYGRVLPVDLTDLPGAVYMVKLYYDDGVRTSEKTFKVIVAK